MLNDITSPISFSDVRIGMRFGFDMGVRYPPSYIFTPPNHNSACLIPIMLSHTSKTNYLMGAIPAPF